MKRSSKLVHLALKSNVDLSVNDDLITLEDLQIESPIPPDAEWQWELYKSEFGKSFDVTSSDIIIEEAQSTKNTYTVTSSSRASAENSCCKLFEPSASTSSSSATVRKKRISTEETLIVPDLNYSSSISKNPSSVTTQNVLACVEQHVSTEVTPLPSPSGSDIEFGADAEDTRSRCSNLSSPAYSSEASTPGGRTSRKRQRNRNEWKDVKRKVLVNSGQAYVSKTGVSRDGKCLKPSCPSTCRLKCSNKFSEEQRKRIFNSFWMLSDHTRQWDYIANHTEVNNTQFPSRSRVNSRRSKTFTYFLPQVDTLETTANKAVVKIVVCKTMFLNTLSVGERTVHTAIQKWCSGGGAISPDRRGGCRGTKIDDDVIQGVVKHVKCLQPVESHYVRSKTNRLYLDGTLTFRKMFYMYQEWCNTEGINKQATTIRQYTDIVNSNLNIAFHKPKKDVCNQCHVFEANKVSNTIEETEVQQKHLRNKELARDLKNRDKEDALKSKGKIVTACFDFQKILNCPQGNVGLFYYKRKLSLLNFTVFDLAQQEGYCYMWPETNGKHGACEVCSCLLKFIELKIKDGAKEFRFWSDNCAGQNRNRIVFAFYGFVARKYNIEVTHRFLESGHTQNEADSVHALIEKSSKNKDIYTPHQWYALVRWAKVTPPSYNVFEMSYTDFFNFKDLLIGHNWVKNTKKEKMSWNKIREISVSPSYSNILNYRYDFNNEQIMSIVIGKGYSRRNKNNDQAKLNQCYENPLPITAAKYKDLVSLCQNRIIPNEYHQYFLNLPHLGDDQETYSSSSDD